MLRNLLKNIKKLCNTIIKTNQNNRIKKLNQF